MTASSRGIELVTPARLGDLVARFGGLLPEVAKETRIRAIAPIHVASEGELAPLTSARHVRYASASRAALLVDSTLSDRCPALCKWVHPNAAWVLSVLLSDLAIPKEASDLGEGPDAFAGYVAKGARVHPSARIMPGVVILGGCSIGPETHIEPNAVLYGRVAIGARVVIGAGAVIGRPGFGWVTDPAGAIRRMPQLGGVIIEDDVELGPLCTVDAGTLGPTIVGKGAKLDAQVHVGHNAEIGEKVIVAAQSGFAGSVRIGPGTLVGGQTGVADHVVVGAGAQLAAKAGVIGDIPAGGVVAGYPAVDRVRWLRGMARLLRPSKPT